MNIKYPNGKKVSNNKITHINSRGMLFESELNIANEYYRTNNLAIIYKKPTPIQVVKVSYPERSKAKIVEAYYKTPSTTDYNGIYKTKYIDFEAKQTDNASFSFKHIFPHQIIHLKKIDEQGGIAFVIIYFKILNQVFIIDIKDFYREYTNNLHDGPKSIKACNITNIGGVEVLLNKLPIVDYLKAVDSLYFNQKSK